MQKLHSEARNRGETIRRKGFGDNIIISGDRNDDKAVNSRFGAESGEDKIFPSDRDVYPVKADEPIYSSVDPEKIQ